MQTFGFIGYLPYVCQERICKSENLKIDISLLNVINLPVSSSMDATVNHDHLQQYMVNFNPIDKDYFVR